MTILISKKVKTMYVLSATEVEMWSKKYFVSYLKQAPQACHWVIPSAVPFCSALTLLAGVSKNELNWKEWKLM